MRPRYFYHVYGIALSVDEPLQSLPRIDGTPDPAVTLSFVEPAYFRGLVPPERIVRPEGDWIAHAFLPDGRFYLDAPTVVEAVLSADGRSVACARRDAADARAVEANLLNIVIASALTLAGEEPLHGTAVDLGGHAIGLLGHSGAGKSSLAAFLVSTGARLLTDDVLRVEFVDGQAIAYPGPHRLKLFDEPAKRFLPNSLADGHFNTLSGKMMIPPPGPAIIGRGTPLAALYFLGELPGLAEPTQPSAIPLSGEQVLRVLLSSAMDDRNASPARLARQLRFAGQLAALVPIRALRYPRRFDLMDAVAQEIRRTLTS